MSKIAQLEQRLRAVEKGKTIHVNATGANVAVNSVTSSLNRMGAAGMRAITQLKLAFADFSRIVARRIAFSVATAINRVIITAIMAIPAAFALAIVAGGKFEDAMLRTAVVASQGLEGLQKNYDILSLKARRMARETTFTASEVANAMFELVSSGLSVQETVASIGSVINFAGANMTNLGTSVDLLTQVLKSFNMEASDLDDVADILTGAINTTTLTVERLQNAMRFAAPAAGALVNEFRNSKTALVETTAVLSFFVDVTKQGGIAGRAFRQTIAKLANTEAPNAQKALGKLGLTSEEVDVATRSLNDVFVTLAGTTFGLEDAITLMGTRAGPVASLAVNRLRLEMQEAQAAGVEFTGTIQDAQEKLAQSDAIDQAAKQYQDFMKSTQSGWKLLRAAGEEFLLQIFDRIRPAIKAFQDFGKEMIISFGPSLAKIMVDGARRVASAIKILIVVFGVKGLIGVFRLARTEILLFHSTFLKTTTSMRVQAAVQNTTVGMLKLKKAFSAAGNALRSPGGLFLGFLLLIEIMKRFNERGVDMLASVRGIRKAFGGLGTDAKSTADNFSLMAAIGDIFAIAMNGISMAIMGVLSFMAQTVAEMGRLMNLVPGFNPVSEEFISGWDRTAVSLSNSTRALEEENTELLATIGVTQESTVAGEAELDQMEERIKKLKEMGAPDGVIAKVREAEGALQEERVDIISTLAQMVDEEGEALELAERGEIALIRERAALAGIGDQAEGYITVLLRHRAATEELEAAKVREKAAQDALNQSYEDAVARIEKLISAGDTAMDVTRPEEFSEAILSIGASLYDILSNKEYSQAFKENTVDSALNALDVLTADLIERFGEIPEELAKDIDASIGVIVDFMGSYAMVQRDAINEMHDAWEDSPTNSVYAKKELDEMYDVYNEAFEKVGESGKNVFKAIANGMSQAIADMIVDSKNFVDSIQKLFKGLFATTMFNAIGEFQNKFTMMMGPNGKMVEHTGSFFTKIGDGFEGMAESMSGTGPALLAGANAAFGGMEAIAMGALSAVSSFATGDWIGGIIASVGVAIGLLKKLFGDKDSPERRAEQLGAGFKDLGGITDDLALEIGELAYELAQAGEEFANTIAWVDKFNEVLEETGITNENSGEAMSKFLQIVNEYTAGHIDAAQATEALTDSIPLLLENLDTLDKAGVIAFRQFINNVREAGLEIDALNEHLKTQADTIVETIGALLDTGIKLSQEQLNFAISAVGHAFAEMILQGASLREVFEQLGPLLQRLKDRAKELGLDLPKSFKSVLRLGKLFKDETIGPMLEGMDLMIEAFNALISMGIIPSKKEFRSLEEQAADTYATMMEEGVDAEEALRAMAPTLALLRRLAEEYGFELDETTQDMITAAEAQGILGDEAETTNSVLKDGFDRVIDAIERMINAMLGIPDTLENVADRSKRHFDDIEGYSQDAADHVSEDWDDVEDDLVGHSVFPDIAKGAMEAFKLVDKSGTAAVDNLSKRFANMDSVGATMDMISDKASLGATATIQDQRTASLITGLSKVIGDSLAAIAEGDTNFQVSIGDREIEDVIVRKLRTASINGNLSLSEDAIGYRR